MMLEHGEGVYVGDGDGVQSTMITILFHLRNL